MTFSRNGYTEPRDTEPRRREAMSTTFFNEDEGREYTEAAMHHTHEKEGAF
jgi:hypothetical protein